MTRKDSFVTNNYYHVYNRGVDKRTIFGNKSDYYRFIHNLYEFNSEDAAINLNRRLIDRGETSINNRKERKLLVNIVCYCLMPNHFHLILQQRVRNGITKFMRKIGTGYTMYFNTKNERRGVLFEGAFKAIWIEDDSYLMHLSRYIHLNPAKLATDADKIELADMQNNQTLIKELLKAYRWSSYRDYAGKHNFPSVINKKAVLTYFNGKEDYAKFILDYAAEDEAYIKALMGEA